MSEYIVYGYKLDEYSRSTPIAIRASQIIAVEQKDKGGVVTVHLTNGMTFKLTPDMAWEQHEGDSAALYRLLTPWDSCT